MSRVGVEGNWNDRPGSSGGLVSALIAGRLSPEPLFAGLVDPSNDAVRIDDIPHRPNYIRFVRAGARFGGTGVVDGREGSLFPVLERGGVNWGLVYLVQEELLRVWVERLGIGPALANRRVLVGEVWFDVDRRARLGVVGGEERATHWRLDEGEGAFC